MQPAEPSQTAKFAAISLNHVVRELRAAFSTIEDIHDVGAVGGLRMERIRASRSPDMYWQQVLMRALDEGPQSVDRVLDAAMARSERKALHEAVQRYRAQRAR